MKAMLLGVGPIDAALLVGALGCIACIFCSDSALHGPLLYDDKAAVLQMPVVVGTAPLSHAWEVDFWGTPMTSADSHKSWRPLVTLAYAANYASHGEQTFGYHVVNVAIHAAVSAVVLPATQRRMSATSRRAWPRSSSQCIPCT